MMEKTKYPGIKYDRTRNVYVVSLDFGRFKVFDEKSGEYKMKQKKTNITAKSLAEARQIKEEHDRKKRDGKLQGTCSKITFRQASDEYFEDRSKNRHGKEWSENYAYRQRTHQRRINDYLQSMRMDERPIRSFSIRDIEDYFDWCTEAHEIEIVIVDETGKLRKEIKHYEALGYNTVEKIKSFLIGFNKFLMKDFDRYGVGREIVSLAEISAEDEEFEPTVLNSEQVNALIRYALDFEMREHMGAPLINIVLGCLCGGMRRGEQLGVKWSDIQPPTSAEADDGRIHILRQRMQKAGGGYREKTPKGGKDSGKNEAERKQRWSPLPWSAWVLLQIVRQEQSRYRTISDDDYIYQEPDSLNGNYLPNPRHINRRFNEFQKRCNRARKKAGLEEIPHVRLHDLRHTFAGLLQHFDGAKYPEIGWIDHDLISYAMGHRTKGTTVTEKVYLHDNGVRTRLNKALDICITTELKRHDYNNQ